MLILNEIYSKLILLQIFSGNVFKKGLIIKFQKAVDDFTDNGVVLTDPNFRKVQKHYLCRYNILGPYLNTT